MLDENNVTSDKKKLLNKKVVGEIFNFKRDREKERMDIFKLGV
jgi:hypothetical protein